MEQLCSTRTEEARVDSLLVTSPPSVSMHDAQLVAQLCYPAFTECAPLAGERDVNFKISAADGRALTLKFVNPAEHLAETVMQIAVLKHLNGGVETAVPPHCPALIPDAAHEYGISPGLSTGVAEQLHDWINYCAPGSDHAIRVRAYGYLEGRPGHTLKASPEALESLGRCIGSLGVQLADFDHPAAHRKLLWDTAQVLGLEAMLDAVKDVEERQMIGQYLEIFARRIAPALTSLPRQVIHNDLSPSNILVDDAGLAPVGVLDFGDMVVAPRIADIAIAASYQMKPTSEALWVLATIVRGYESVAPLDRQEVDRVLDLVMARLVQRMVITSWRAERFPANRDYILRSHAAATALFGTLHDEWARLHS